MFREQNHEQEVGSYAIYKVFSQRAFMRIHPEGFYAYYDMLRVIY